MKNTVLILLMIAGLAGNAHGQCAAPTNLQTSYSNDVTTFSIDAVSGATGYVIEIKQSWDSWAYPEWIDTFSSASYTLSGIMHSISIDWRVKTICSGGESGYSETSFTVPCPQPGAPVASNITMSGATVGWTPAAGYNTFISNFYVAYRPSGSTSWISAGSTSGSTKNLSNLLANTTYEWRVYQSCPYSSSTYLTSTFTTLGCTSAGINSTEWISLFKVGTINRTSTAESGGYLQTNLSTNLAVGSNNAARIKVGNSGSFLAKRYKVYIDYNNNNIFEESETVHGPASITGTGNINFTLSIPANAPGGQHKMRVIMARNNVTITGCISGHLGETEDYTVNLTGGSNKESLAASGELAEEGKMAIYPNPVSNVLNIDLPEAATINIYDLMGKKVYQLQATQGGTQVDAAQWPAGQYILQAIDKEGNIEVVRFVKQ